MSIKRFGGCWKTSWCRKHRRVWFFLTLIRCLRPELNHHIYNSNSAPFRLEPINGTGIAHFNVYSNIFGYGKTVETPIFRPDYANPGIYTLSNRIVFIFPDL